MTTTEALAISLKVIADWRVIAITVAVLLIWAALRYVGSVYSGPSSSRRRGGAPRVPRIAAPKRSVEPRVEAEDESEDDLIE